MKHFLSYLLFSWVLFYHFSSIAGITISSPSSSSQITACKNYNLYYSATSGFSTYVLIEVHQNNSSGAIVKTYSNVSSIYISANYNNTMSSLGLAPGKYQIKIYDYYNSAFYGWSDIFTISALLPPASVSYNGYSTPSSFEINWSNSTGATEFRLDVSTDSNFSSILSSYNDYHASGSDSGGLYVSGIDNAVPHYVRVRGYNSCSTSSNSLTLMVPAYVCTPSSVPVATAATSITSTSFTAHWNAAANITTGYNLAITKSGSSPITIQTYGTSYTYNSAQSYSNYSYSVKSIGCQGSSANSNTIFLSTPLAAPVINYAGGSGGTGANFTWTIGWNTIIGATGYHIQVSLYDNFSSIVYEKDLSGNQANFEANYCDEYFVRVKSTNSTGASVYSSTYNLPAGACGGIISGRTNKQQVIAVQNIQDVGEFSVYPNPAEGHLKISFPNNLNSNNISVSLKDLSGVLFEIPCKMAIGVVDCDISETPSGMYILSIIVGNTYNKKIKIYKK